MDDSSLHWSHHLCLYGTSLALDPQLQLHRHQMVEYITTQENPRRLTLMDEEMHDDYLAQFGAACTVLPSSVPQRMNYRAYRRG